MLHTMRRRRVCKHANIVSLTVWVVEKECSEARACEWRG